MFAPRTPRHFDSHLGRGSIHHTHGTRGAHLTAPGCLGLCAPVPVCTCESSHVPCFTCGGHVSAQAHICAPVYKCSFEDISRVPMCLDVSACARVKTTIVYPGVCICVCTLSWVSVFECICDRTCVGLCMLSCALHVGGWTSACRQACTCEFLQVL